MFQRLAGSKTLITGIVAILFNAARAAGWDALSPEVEDAVNVILISLLAVFLRDGVAKAEAAAK